VTAVLNPLYIAVAWVITQIHTGVGAVISPDSGLAWVLTIVILVILMRLVLLPLFIKQMHATRKMAALAPQMQELRKRYKNDRQTLNEETMKLYRENGVNPLGGCLPLVAQLPLFFALFGVLRGISDWHLGQPTPFHLTKSVIESAQHALIFGASISDKVLFTGQLHVPLHAKIVILFAVAVSVVTTYMTVRQSTKRGMTPQMTPDNPMAASQKYMTYVVPLFALSGLYWQFGLVLYWMMTNLWTLGQQYVLFKRFPSLTAPVTPAGTSGTGPSTGAPRQQAAAKPRQGGGPKQVPGAPRQAPRPPRVGPAGPKQRLDDGRQAGDGARTAGGAAQGGGQPAPAQGKDSAAGGKQSAASPGGKQERASSGAKQQPTVGSQQGPAGAGANPAARKPASVPAPSKQAPGQARKQAGAGQGNRPSGGQAKPGGSRAPGTGQQAGSNGSGLLRRFGKARAEPEPEPETPKLVRQQRVRQPRSKRSGKR
jgi:YidC/Oxa1 family membrane protein insertase